MRYDSLVGACMKAVDHQCPLLWPSESSELFPQRNVQASHKTRCRFIALLTQSYCMQQSHSTHAHSTASPAPSDQYSEVVIVHACTFQYALLGCQVTSMQCKVFSLYYSGWTFSGQTSHKTICIVAQSHILVKVFLIIFAFGHFLRP